MRTICRRGSVRAATAILVSAAVQSMCAAGQPAHVAEADQARARAAMVAGQIAARGITDGRVLDAMRAVPRHRFVPAAQQSLAYSDQPLPIGYGQTISQPFIVAYMTEALRVGPTDRVLEIGTGSGYQAAVLATIAKQVYTIEIVPELARHARETLRTLGYSNVEVMAGDGYLGWPAHAPFDRIMVTAAPDHVPQPLVDQLAAEGRMVLPVGELFQKMTILTKTSKGLVTESTIDVAFVPLVRRPGRR